MRNFLFYLSKENFEQVRLWANLKQEQVNQAVQITSDVVTGYLKRQLEKGNMKAVKDVLKGKPMTAAGKFIFAELRGKVISKLVLKLGLRRVVAAGIALLLLPLILAKVAGKLLSITKSHYPNKDL